MRGTPVEGGERAARSVARELYTPASGAHRSASTMNQLLLTLVGALVLAASGPDRVKLQDGKVLEGRVVQEGKDAIVLRQDKKDRTIPRKDVAELTTLERSLATITAREVPTGDAAALAALAGECDKAGLAEEARLMWLRVLLVDPAHAAALAAVEARPLKDDVQVTFGKEKRKLSELRATQAKWKDAYELQTTHFVLRTDVPLARALDIGLNLERFHKTFYELLGQPLELYVFDPRELPEIRVYGELDAYPSPPTANQRVWFGMAENCLHVEASQQVHLPTVVAELSRQMLFSAMRRSAGPTAEVPAWVTSAISEYFGWTTPPKADMPWPAASEPVKELFKRAAKTDLSFERVFHGARNDFTDAANAADMSACAYTLLHFFAFARDRALNPGFGRYVTEGAKGRLSLGALTEQVGMKADEIDKAWREYVRFVAN